MAWISGPPTRTSRFPFATPSMILDAATWGSIAFLCVSSVAPYLEPSRVPDDAPFYSTLCGACSEICPVRIPIAELIAKRREKLWREGKTPVAVRSAVGLWKRAQNGAVLGPVLRPLLIALLRSPSLRRLAQITRRGARR